MPFPLNHCEKCGSLTSQPEDDYCEFICLDCQSNAAEAAWERYCADFHDGGATQFITFEQRMADAMRLK